MRVSPLSVRPAAALSARHAATRRPDNLYLLTVERQSLSAVTHSPSPSLYTASFVSPSHRTCRTSIY